MLVLNVVLALTQAFVVIQGLLPLPLGIFGSPVPLSVEGGVVEALPLLKPLGLDDISRHEMFELR